ncbi:MAG: hypothetical protein HY597_01285 [Candidatus Omnitrophica bacterium]|nr:hypothetical protein [Candidatus Omnitrophota bacterium]
MRRSFCIVGILLFSLTGCSRHRSALMFERRVMGAVETVGPIRDVGLPIALDPPVATVTKEGVEVTVRYASGPYLNAYFKNRAIFGEYAGLNPYYPLNLVFYVKLVNKHGDRIKIDPAQFVVIDDVNTQYEYLSPDFMISIAESKDTAGRMVRAAIESPSWYGIHPGQVLTGVAGQSQQRHALLKQVTMTPGYLHNGVTYDGMIAFWQPLRPARKLRLVLSGIKTDFDANDWPKNSIDVDFEFKLIQLPKLAPTKESIAAEEQRLEAEKKRLKRERKSEKIMLEQEKERLKDQKQTLGHQPSPEPQPPSSP